MVIKMLKKTAVFFLSAVFALLLAAGVLADGGPRVYILDSRGYLSETEVMNIGRAADSFADKSGFNVILVITDDIGSPKTDSHAVEYADDLYDEYCGTDTDGILLLINNDTKYDYISTSGVCINYYSDYRIERILDEIHGYLADGSYADAAREFIYQAEYYYGLGKANNQHSVAGLEVDIDELTSTLAFLFIMAFAVGGIIFAVNLKSYNIKKASNAFYINKNSLRFNQRTDVFMGTFTSRVYSPRSSGGSGGRSGSGHRSSTHRSSGGGRHGGGGRHR